MHNIFSDLHNLIEVIFFGDFGLLTLTPRYLFLVLFPIMILVGFASEILTKIPFMKKYFFHFIGLGCTTAALTALDDNPWHKHLVLTLVLIIPCSSQLSLIATFVTLVTLRVFLFYLILAGLFVCTLLFFINKFDSVNKAYASCHNEVTEEAKKTLSIVHIVYSAFWSVISTLPTFCAGSVLISIAMYLGVLDYISEALSPLFSGFLNLPKEAITLLILNVLKRDFGSASLLAISVSGCFSAIDLIVVLIMMTFTVPCFNTSILIIKREGFLFFAKVFMLSLFVSLLAGKTASILLLLTLGS